MSFTYLNESEREQLRQLPFPVALPNQLPPGWSAAPLKVVIEPDYASLTAVFNGPQPAMWEVFSTNDGIGDPPPGDSFEYIENGLFGHILIRSYSEDGIPEIQSNWFQEGEEADHFHAFHGLHVGQDDLKVLVQSLEMCDASES